MDLLAGVIVVLFFRNLVGAELSGVGMIPNTLTTDLCDVDWDDPIDMAIAEASPDELDMLFEAYKFAQDRESLFEDEGANDYREISGLARYGY